MRKSGALKVISSVESVYSYSPLLIRADCLRIPSSTIFLIILPFPDSAEDSCISDSTLSIKASLASSVKMNSLPLIMLSPIATSSCRE